MTIPGSKCNKLLKIYLENLKGVYKSPIQLRLFLIMRNYPRNPAFPGVFKFPIKVNPLNLKFLNRG